MQEQLLMHGYLAPRAAAELANKPTTGVWRPLCSRLVAILFGSVLSVCAPWLLADTLTDEPLQPLPSQKSLNLDPRKVELGRQLFNDKRMSEDRTVNCASCHFLEQGGSDNRKVSIGIHGEVGRINAPTIFNTGFNFRQFWDGRAATLEEQIDAVVASPKSFGSTWPNVIARLSEDKALVATVQSIYPEGMRASTISDAIATYERSLITPSRFDRYLGGDENAINKEEKAGYEKFKAYGCIGCHQGRNVGGNMFQKFGAVNDYFEKRGNVTPADFGRFNVTKRETDRYVFKVPSLRNVALTAPYFHDGTASTLEEAVEVMFQHQLGRTAPKEDKQLIVQFLRSLTGEQFKGAK